MCANSHDWCQGAETKDLQLSSPTMAHPKRITEDRIETQQPHVLIKLSFSPTGSGWISSPLGLCAISRSNIWRGSVTRVWSPDLKGFTRWSFPTGFNRENQGKESSAWTPLTPSPLAFGRSPSWISWEKVCFAEAEPMWLGSYHLDDPDNLSPSGAGLCLRATEPKTCNTYPPGTFTVASAGLGAKDTFSENMFIPTSAWSPCETSDFMSHQEHLNVPSLKEEAYPLKKRMPQCGTKVHLLDCVKNGK